jgi:outer membrane protein assembly factor BamB
MTRDTPAGLIWALPLLAIIAPPASAGASTFVPKTDNAIIALDLKTGQLIWEYKPKTLSDAHFAAYPKGVVAYPHYSADNKTKPIFLHPKTGKRIAAFRRRSADLMGRSTTFHPPAPVVLSNGWRLSGYSPGNTKTLQFVDRRNKPVWSIPTPGYPHRVGQWKDVVFWAYSYLSKDGLLHAHRAGQRKALWKVDLNRLVGGSQANSKAPRFHGRIRAQPLTRMIFQILDGTLYVNANEHLFALDPASGRLRWHRDVARELGLKYHPDFFGGALNLAVFAKSGGVLVVAFEKRVVALDLKRGRYLWHLQPDTFPHCPFPVIYKDRVILTSGAKRKLVRIK